MKVLHLIFTYFPLVSGYTVRTKNIFKVQKNLNIQFTAATMPEFKNICPSVSNKMQLDDVTLFNFPKYKNTLLLNMPYVGNRLRVKKNLKHFLTIIKQFQPNIIHAHSPFICGEYAKMLSKISNIPFVYEIRGLWEDTAVTENKFSEDSKIYKMRKNTETQVARDANAVVVISNGLKKDFTARGVDNIYVAKNGVDYDTFQNKINTLFNKNTTKWGDKFVIGYIGSIRRIEGIDLVINLMKDLIKINKNIRLLLIGGGTNIKELKDLTKKNGLEKYVEFEGEVKPDDAIKYYGLLDVFVLPRIRSRVTELVTPLKPLEAMCLNVPVLGSDVGGISELIEDKQTGILFKAEDKDDFINKIKILFDEKIRDDLKTKANKFVKDKMTWNKTLSKYKDIYENMIEK